MPDAFSKTVPIWCAVMNRVLFPSDEDSAKLHLMPGLTSESEAAQIEAHLDGFVTSFKVSSSLSSEDDIIRFFSGKSG